MCVRVACKRRVRLCEKKGDCTLYRERARERECVSEKQTQNNNSTLLIRGSEMRAPPAALSIGAPGSVGVDCGWRAPIQQMAHSALGSVLHADIDVLHCGDQRWHQDLDVLACSAGVVLGNLTNKAIDK